MIKSRRLRWAGHIARMEEGRSALQILTSKLTGQRLRTGSEDHIRIGFKEVSVNSWNWIDSAEDRKYCIAIVNATLNIRVS